MNAFEDSKEEMGLPADGQKVTFKWPCEHSWFVNVVEDQKYLAKDQEYTVRRTQLNSSSAYVWLEEIKSYNEEHDQPFFNLWCFDWEGKIEEDLDFLLEEL